MPTPRRSGEIELKLTSGAEMLAVDHVLVCAGRTSPTARAEPGGGRASGCPSAG